MHFFPDSGGKHKKKIHFPILKLFLPSATGFCRSENQLCVVFFELEMLYNIKDDFFFQTTLLIFVGPTSFLLVEVEYWEKFRLSFCIRSLFLDFPIPTGFTIFYPCAFLHIKIVKRYVLFLCPGSSFRQTFSEQPRLISTVHLFVRNSPSPKKPFKISFEVFRCLFITT